MVHLTNNCFTFPVLCAVPTVGELSRFPDSAWGLWALLFISPLGHVASVMVLWAPLLKGADLEPSHYQDPSSSGKQKIRQKAVLPTLRCQHCRNKAMASRLNPVCVCVANGGIEVPAQKLLLCPLRRRQSEVSLGASVLMWPDSRQPELSLFHTNSPCTGARFHAHCPVTHSSYSRKK